MTDNSKTPPAKKTIQDPPEYAAGRMGTGNITRDWLGGPQNGEEATYQQNGQQVVVPTGTGDQAKETAGTKDWLGGPQNGAEAPGSKESGPTGSGKAQGEGARNPQTGERIARNPQTGE
ncbi:hypothetical protein ELI11_04395 [Rhizobium ruizarguesonis]|nr:hypothetical protein ELI16_31925 [Rhizobium ruizarguesonis]TAW92575.1 hypothetical protein ELI11_04395 [Rhizobium ruizarguesonis]